MSPRVSAKCFKIVGNRVEKGIPLVSRSLDIKLPWEFIQNGDAEEFFAAQFDRYSRTVQPASDVGSRFNLIYFEVPDLDFKDRPLVEGLNLWPGGEWHNGRPFWRQTKEGVDARYARQVLERAEMWLLTSTHALFLADQFGAVRILRSVTGHTWRLEKIDENELFFYIAKRGLKITTHRGTLWALKNLERICEAYPRRSDFASVTKDVRRRLPKI